jgi:hypothetical protein
MTKTYLADYLSHPNIAKIREIVDKTIVTTMFSDGERIVTHEDGSKSFVGEGIWRIGEELWNFGRWTDSSFSP